MPESLLGLVESARFGGGLEDALEDFLGRGPGDQLGQPKYASNECPISISAAG